MAAVRLCPGGHEPTFNHRARGRRVARSSSEVLVCRLVGGKVTYVHRRLWPALVRLAPEFSRGAVAALREIHTPSGRHVLRVVPFPQWVPPEVKRQARRLSEAQATRALGK